MSKISFLTVVHSLSKLSLCNELTPHNGSITITRLVYFNLTTKSCMRRVLEHYKLTHRTGDYGAKQRKRHRTFLGCGSRYDCGESLISRLRTCTKTECRHFHECISQPYRPLQTRRAIYIRMRSLPKQFISLP